MKPKLVLTSLSTLLGVTIAHSSLTPEGKASVYTTSFINLNSITTKLTSAWEENQIYLFLFLLLIFIYFLFFLIRPLWLLKIPSPHSLIPGKIGIFLNQIIKYIKYRDRVLDAWVETHWETAKSDFSNLSTVEQRSIHISLPIRIEKHTVNDFSPQDLIDVFQRKMTLLSIHGKGGSGKTSLACQIAQWGLTKKLSSYRIIPILLESDLSTEFSFIRAIQGKLDLLTNESEILHLEFIEKLLKRKRVLVIIDHLSEMNAETRNQIKPQSADFPAKTIIVTSRINESFDEIPKTLVQPLEIDANRLWPFMSLYLEAKGKSRLFEDYEYASSCDRLRHIVGDNKITVLLAQLYIEQIINEREGAGGILPDSVPKLMLSYLNLINRQIQDTEKIDIIKVQHDVKALSWKCLEHNYYPSSITTKEALSTLEKIDTSISPKKRLDYLESRINFIQTSESGDSIHIILDPLAEYLAALYWVEDICQGSDVKINLQNLFTSIDHDLKRNNGSPESIRGFLISLRDCCMDSSDKKYCSNEIIDEISIKANIDPEELRNIRETRRIHNLISELSDPDERFRIEAAKKLSEKGDLAKKAAPNLIGMLKNNSQTLAARQAAATALGKLKTGEESLLSILENPNESPILRRTSAESLGMMESSREILEKIVNNNNQPLPVRQGAAFALTKFGSEDQKKLPILIVEYTEEEKFVQSTPIQVWKENLPSGTSLQLVHIPEGGFMMGSPHHEDDRHWYHEFYPETRGVDVEEQHLVHIPSLYMGQFPITQEQWQAIALLPKVDRELNPHTANFEGDLNPVERVSWNDTLEFCKRLSRHTGKEYRLPSEAEWEYACRAGTMTPFHFGFTLSTDLANYDGNFTYDEGVQGEFRKRTTEVGKFGVANRFGLFDMHGNVLEWCLDTWQASYEGTPGKDSSLAIKKESYQRVVRGGSWGHPPKFCRSACRDLFGAGSDDFYVGFRVCYSTSGENKI